MIKKATSLLLSMSLAGFLSAQSNWSHIGPAFDASVNTIIEDTSTLDLYAGGTFTKAGSLSRVGIAKWNGTQWYSLGNGMVTGSGVLSLGFYNGDLIATGTFTDLDSVPCKNIGAWNGTSWSPLGDGLDYTGATTVSTQIIYGGDLYVAGTFSSSGTTTLNNIAKWDGTSWSALGTGINGPVNKLCVYNGELYAAGSFTSAGGVSVHNIAKWDGSSWSDAGGGVQKYTGATTVSTMLNFGQLLYVGGDFNTAGGDTVNHMAAWNGTSWSDANGGGLDYTGATTVSTQFMGEYSNALIASVTYTINATGTPAYKMMSYKNGVWSTSHTLDAPFSALISYNNSLCVSGGFTMIDSDTVSFLAVLMQSSHKALTYAAAGPNDYTLYPNPVDEELNIRITLQDDNDPQAVNFELFDISGRSIMHLGEITAPDVRIARSGIAPGMYLYRITGSKDNRLIKQGKLSFK